MAGKNDRTVAGRARDAAYLYFRNCRSEECRECRRGTCAVSCYEPLAAIIASQFVSMPTQHDADDVRSDIEGAIADLQRAARSLDD